MKMKVLGSGCMSCKRLYDNAKEATRDMENVELEYITDMEKIISYGIMRTPAIVIDDNVVSQGIILSKEDIKKLLKNSENAESCCDDDCKCNGDCE